MGVAQQLIGRVRLIRATRQHRLIVVLSGLGEAIHTRCRLGLLGTSLEPLPYQEP